MEHRFIAFFNLLFTSLLAWTPKAIRERLAVQVRCTLTIFDCILRR